MSIEAVDLSLIGHFANLEDPRDASKARHKLLDMVAIAIAGVMCGADDWVSIASFARAKEGWFRRYLELPNGIPSHDTLGRVFSLLAPGTFETCFRAWIDSIRAHLPDEVVAIDGKSVRRSHDRAAGLGPLHMVSAWASDHGIVLGQIATAAKSNEIEAIPRLLELLALNGCIVTIDARQVVRPRSPRASSRPVPTTCWHSKETKAAWPRKSRRHSSMPMPGIMLAWTRRSWRPSNVATAVPRHAVTEPWDILTRSRAVPYGGGST